ncbi:MAG TPA: hypothetical protein VHS97_13680, partial [Isosphaeraceae bacterium]|nr:hypothetical protein [Isosphaeraceae bacterium]
LGPTLPDQRERPIEIEKHVGDICAGLERSRQLDAGPVRMALTWLGSSAHNQGRLAITAILTKLTTVGRDERNASIRPVPGMIFPSQWFSL